MPLTPEECVYAVQPDSHQAQRGPCCLTYTGGWFYLQDPRPEEMKLIDAVHNAARQCRYGGGISFHYSPAQHMVLCSWVASELGLGPGVEYECLMHDIHEGIMMDVPRPHKLLLSGKGRADVTGQVVAYLREHGFTDAEEIELLVAGRALPPIVADVHVEGYNDLESKIAQAYADKYGFTFPMPAACREIDDRMLHTEARDLGVRFNMTWGGEENGPYDFIRVIPTTAEYAKDLWIRRFCDLTGAAHEDVVEGRV